MHQLLIKLCLGLILGLGLLACSGPPPSTPPSTESPTATVVPTPTSTSVPPTPALSRPVEVTLEPAKDGTLYQDDAGSLSNGAGQHLFAGVTSAGSLRRSVIAFDIAGAIPTGSTITSATLTLNVSRTHGEEQVVTLHPLLAGWDEGTSDAPGNEGSGAPSTTGDVTWIHRSFDAAEWTEPGGDFSPTASASLPVSQPGKYTWGPTPEMTSDVQAWLDGPGNNFGWLLKGNEAEARTTKRFDSRQHEELDLRPVLMVEYLPPQAP